MRENKPAIREPVPTLRRWREAAGLSRQKVADIVNERVRADRPFSQATIAKWESGESAVRVIDLKLLAKIYGTTADRLLFDPGNSMTPEHMRRAQEIVATKNPEAIETWLKQGEWLPDRPDSNR